MNQFPPPEAREEDEGEEETSFIDDDEDELSNQTFRDRLKRLGGDPVVEDPFEIQGNEDTDVLRAKLEKQLLLKKYILTKVFGDHFDPKDGEKSKDLFNFIEVTRDPETGKINGVQFKGKQVIIRRGASAIFNPKVDISGFQKAVAEAQAEFDNTPLGRFKKPFGG